MVKPPCSPAKDSDTHRHRLTAASARTACAAEKPCMSCEYVRREKAGADKMESKTHLGSLRRAVFEGDTTTGSLIRRSGGRRFTRCAPVADILNDLWEGGGSASPRWNELC